MRICIYALDGAFDTGLTALLDTFDTANELAALTGGGPAPFEVTVVGAGRRIRTALGMSMAVQSADDVPRPDWALSLIHI